MFFVGKTFPFRKKKRFSPRPFPKENRFTELGTAVDRVYLKKEEATARADFSSVQGGKPKVYWR